MKQIDKNIGLNKRLMSPIADSVLSVVSEGLAATQKESSISLVKVLSLKVKKSIVKNWKL